MWPAVEHLDHPNCDHLLCDWILCVARLDNLTTEVTAISVVHDDAKLDRSKWSVRKPAQPHHPTITLAHYRSFHEAVVASSVEYVRCARGGTKCCHVLHLVVACVKVAHLDNVPVLQVHHHADLLHLQVILPQIVDNLHAGEETDTHLSFNKRKQPVPA